MKYFVAAAAMLAAALVASPPPEMPASVRAEGTRTGDNGGEYDRLFHSAVVSVLSQADALRGAGSGNILTNLNLLEAEIFRLFLNAKRFKQRYGDHSWADVSDRVRQAFVVAEQAIESQRPFADDACERALRHLEAYRATLGVERAKQVAKR